MREREDLNQSIGMASVVQANTPLPLLLPLYTVFTFIPCYTLMLMVSETTAMDSILDATVTMGRGKGPFWMIHLHRSYIGCPWKIPLVTCGDNPSCQFRLRYFYRRVRSLSETLWNHLHHTLVWESAQLIETLSLMGSLVDVTIMDGLKCRTFL